VRLEVADSISSGVMRLASFPVEVHQVISCYLDGFSIGRLWFTGDKILIYKFANHGVIRFAHKLGLRRTKFEFPRLVLSMHGLRELVLKRFKQRKYDAFILPMAELPQGLESLVVNFPIQKNSFSKDPNGSYSPLPLRDMLPSLSTMIISGDFNMDAQTVSALPLLKILKYSSPNPLREDVVRLLPPSLNSLHLRIARYTLGLPEQPKELIPMPNGFSSLKGYCLNIFDANTASSNLTRLSIPSYKILRGGTVPYPLLWPSVAKSLTKLSIAFENVEESSSYLESFAGMLPRTLKHLKVSSSIGSARWLRVKLAEMPTELETLDLQFFDVDAAPWDDMPCKRLQRLRIFSFDTLKSVPILQGAPLTDLDASIAFSTPQLFSAYPGLTRLSIGHFHPQHFSMLPSSLSVLDVSSFDTVNPGTWVPPEPANLPVILTNGSPSDPPEPLTLPANITTFHSCLGGLEWLLANTRTGNLSNPPLDTTFCLFKGPIALTSLDIGCTLRNFSLPNLVSNEPFDSVLGNSTRNYSWSNAFPRSLTRLTLVVHHTLVDDAWLRGLPDSSLTKLRLSVKMEKVTENLPFSSLRFLPDSILNLRITLQHDLHDMEIMAPIIYGKNGSRPMLAPNSRRSTILPSRLERFWLQCSPPITIQEHELDLLPLSLGWIGLPSASRTSDLSVAQADIKSAAAKKGIHLEWLPARNRVIS
jgi:hypothetical protein